MPPFPKPSFSYNYQVAAQINALRAFRDNKPGRQIPAKQADRLLIGSWNVANLGAQKRRDKDHRLIAEIMSWFDLIAVQEVQDDLSGLRGIQQHLPASYRAVFSDRAGNNERLAFFYDNDKVRLLEKVGEVAIPVKDHKHIKLPGVSRKFEGFDRNPYFGSFQAGDFSFLLASVHLYFGSNHWQHVHRRALETYATARWADLRRRDAHAYLKDIIVLGDFNMPKAEPGDAIYDALRNRGLQRPEHSSKVGSNLTSDKHYDQIFFFPGQTKQEFTGNTGIFDFDGAIFASLWDGKTAAQFRSYVKYYISDHRPVWAEFKT